MAFITDKEGRILCECTKEGTLNRGQQYLMPDIINDHFLARAKWKPVQELEKFEEKKEAVKQEPKKDEIVQGAAALVSGGWGDMVGVNKNYELVPDAIKMDESNCLFAGTKAACEEFIANNKPTVFGVILDWSIISHKKDLSEVTTADQIRFTGTEQEVNDFLLKNKPKSPKKAKEPKEKRERKNASKKQLASASK